MVNTATTICTLLDRLEKKEADKALIKCGISPADAGIDQDEWEEDSFEDIDEEYCEEDFEEEYWDEDDYEEVPETPDPFGPGTVPDPFGFPVPPFGSSFGGISLAGTPGMMAPKVRNDDITTLDEIRGQDKVKSKLRSIINARRFEKRLSESKGNELMSEGCNILFLGGPGVSKTTSARAFAKELEDAGIVPKTALQSFASLILSDSL